MKKTNLIAVSLITSISLHAASVPNIGDALKQVKPPKIEREKKEIPQIKTQEEQVPKELQDGKKIEVKKFLITGAVHLSNEVLKSIVEPYENQNLSFNQMLEITSLITKAYREKGYFVARAYIPPQNILTQNGSLKINIIEGNYGKFILENNSLVNDEIVQSNLDDIKEKNIVSSQTLERVMLIINDTPGVTVSKAEVRPGKELGTSDFIIGTDATKPYNGYIIGDNYGSQYTGKHRIMAGVDINSPFKIGDKITAFAMTSEKTGLLSGKVGYEFPLHANGTRAEISYSKTTYELGSTYKNLDAVGSSDSIAAKVSYPIIRTRLENLNSYAQISYNKMKDEIQSANSMVKKDTYVAVAGLDYTKDELLFSKNSQTRAGLSLSAGRLSFEDVADKQNDKAGANTQGQFSKLNLELGKDIELLPTLKWENSFQAQYAFGNKNLDGSQDLSLGGINGVKFYPDGEQSAENGYIFNTELLYTLPSFQALNSTVSVFYDIGRVSMSDNFSNEEFRTLQDFGVGYYGSFKDFFLNAHLAYNIAHDVESQDDYGNRVMIQGGWVF
ncbi:MAG: ShlB/FhaC/HecB family hemolysin secretion/activation protein [Sulfurimonadaceae bacterium]